ncbi:MAG: hypothetical protein HC908_08970 [Calothrix sp. SM1_7_51]|nr:hypothetical protein [Calothrix sp. SM1_7_51]
MNYSIQLLDETGYGFLNNKTARYDFGASQFDFNLSNRGFRMSYLAASPCNIPANPNQIIKLPYAGLQLASVYPNPPFSDILSGWNSGQRVDDFFKWKYLLSKGREDFIGVIFNSIIQGVSNDEKECYSISDFKYQEEPFQTGFWHNSSSDKPLYDNINFGESTGKIIFSGNWENKRSGII